MDDLTPNSSNHEQQPETPQAQQAASPPPPPPPPPPTPPRAAAAYAPAPPKKRTWWPWILGCGCLGILLIIGVSIVGLAGLSGSATSTGPGDKVALIPVTGVIMSGSSQSSPFGGESGAGSQTIIDRLRTAEDDTSVKAIVLRINSPGGSAAASEEIYKEIIRIRKERKIPVVISMADVAASGGYYVAAAGDRIFANSGTITGSIGVIFQSLEMTELFNKIGIKPQTIKSGKHKDMFSSSRPLSEEEKAMAKAMIMDVYNQFVSDVYAGRKQTGLTMNQLLAVADGRIVTGNQALKAKLIDEIGTYQDAINYAAEQGGIKGEPKFWHPKANFWESLMQSKVVIQPKIEIKGEDAGTITQQLLTPGK